MVLDAKEQQHKKTDKNFYLSKNLVYLIMLLAKAKKISLRIYIAEKQNTLGHMIPWWHTIQYLNYIVKLT